MCQGAELEDHSEQEVKMEEMPGTANLVKKLANRPLEKLMMSPGHQEYRGEKINRREMVAKVLA